MLEKIAFFTARTVFGWNFPIDSDQQSRQM
jgi:hypothetical protein